MSKRNLIIKYFVVLARMLSPLFCAAQNGLEVFRLEYGFYPGNTLENKNGDTFDAGSQVFTASFSSEVNKKLQFETILPLKSRFSYHWKPKTYIGLQHSANYNAFVVSNNFRTDELRFGKIRNMTGGIFWEQKLYKNLWLTASGGALFRNVVFLYDENRHETDKLVGGMNHFVNLKLSVKMNKNEGNFN